MGLASGDARFVNIIGAGQETVTRATRRNGEFVYTITRQGDGTVPVAFAELPGARTYYTTVAHSDLARDAVVAQAIADVLRTGETARLDAQWSRNGKAEGASATRSSAAPTSTRSTSHRWSRKRARPSCAT